MKRKLRMDRWIESVYEHSPVQVQHLMVSLYGWKLARLRYGGDFRRHLEQLMKSQYYSETELGEYQNEKFRLLIQQCYENVPYYGKLFAELKLTPDDFRTTADLLKIPVLSKETVRRRPELFYARNYLRAPCEITNTSGTTGTTMRIRVDTEGRRQNYAFFSRLKAWAGIDPAARSATFAGRTIVPANCNNPPFWRYNLANRNILFSSYHLSERNIPAYIDQLRRWRPQLIDTYPSSIYSVAHAMLERGDRLPPIRAVITSSETLWPNQREAVSTALNCPIFDQYGNAEQVCFVSQCEVGTYHIHPEFGVLELLPEPSDPSSGCRIIATGFTNMAMPLLRYDTGDVASPADFRCTCGRNFKVLERILGRADDLILTPDGRRVGRLDPVFKGLSTIRKAQIIQETGTLIRIRVAPGEGFQREHLDSIQHELEKRLGRNMEYTFDVVEDIPVGPGGKFRAVVSKVSKRSNGQNRV